MPIHSAAIRSDPVAGPLAQVAEERYRPWSRAMEIAHWLLVAVSVAVLLLAMLAASGAD